jgi:hypothetical protein
MPQVWREPERSALVYSPRRAIRRTALCRIEGYCAEESSLISLRSGVIS